MSAVFGSRGTTPLGITLAASGAVVAAQAGKRIRVFSVVASTLLATSIKFQSATTDISGTLHCAATGGVVLPAIGMAWFVTAVGEALNLNMSAVTSVGLQVTYDVVE